MLVVPVRVVILHRVPISTHSHFFNPLYSPKPLQILQILQILQSYRHLTDNVPAHVVHSYNCAGCTGPRYFFVHLAQVAASPHSVGGWKIVRRAAGSVSGRRLHVRAGMQKSCIFPAFLPGKVKIFRPEKVFKNPLAHSAPRPDQFYGLEPCEIAGRKVGRRVAAFLRPTLPNVAIGCVSRLALLFLAVSSDVQQADGVPEMLHRRGQRFHSIVKRDDD